MRVFNREFLIARSSIDINTLADSARELRDYMDEHGWEREMAYARSGSRFGQIILEIACPEILIASALSEQPTVSEPTSSFDIEGGLATS